MATTAIMACISLAFGAVRFVSWIWGLTGSEGAQLKRMQEYLAKQKLALEAERSKLAVEQTKIDAQPDKQGQQLVDALNEQFTKKGIPMKRSMPSTRMPKRKKP